MKNVVGINKIINIMVRNYLNLSKNLRSEAPLYSWRDIACLKK